MNRLALHAAAVLWLVSAATASAGLAFTSQRLDFDVKPEDNTVEAVFAFANDTDKTIRVVDVHSNCGCLKAETDKETYEPGEKGTLTAVFTVGSIEGRVEKSVMLQTDAKDGPVQKLTVGINVPSIIEIEPDLTEWIIGEAPAPKSVRIRVVQPDPIRVLEVNCSRNTFTHEVKTIEEGREYEVVLTPSDTSKAQLGVLRIETDCPIEKHRRKMAFFGVVKPKKNTASPAATTATPAVRVGESR